MASTGTQTNPIKPLATGQQQSGTGANPTGTTAAIKPQSQGNTGGEQRFTYSLRIKIGNLEFSNLAGDFLGTPVIRRRTRQVSVSGWT